MDGRFNNTHCKNLLLLAVMCAIGLFLLNRLALGVECGSSLLLLIVSILYMFVLI